MKKKSAIQWLLPWFLMVTVFVLGATWGRIATWDEINQLAGVVIGGSGSDDVPTNSSTATLSGKSFSQDGGILITDTGNTSVEYPLRLRTSNLPDGGQSQFFVDYDSNANNGAVFAFYKDGDGSASNETRIGLQGQYHLRLDGSGNVGVGKISGGAKLDVNGEVEATALDINGAADISGNLSLGTAPSSANHAVRKTELDSVDSDLTTAEGNISTLQGQMSTAQSDISGLQTSISGLTATPSEINARCDGVPIYSQSTNAGDVTFDSFADQIATLNLGSVTSGDIFYFKAHALYSKGGTAGNTTLVLGKDSGTATIEMLIGTTAMSHERYDAASNAYNFELGGYVIVTGSGTLVMELNGASSGSNSTCYAGNAYLGAMFIKKQ